MVCLFIVSEKELLVEPFIRVAPFPLGFKVVVSTKLPRWNTFSPEREIFKAEFIFALLPYKISVNLPAQPIASLS